MTQNNVEISTQNSPTRLRREAVGMVLSLAMGSVIGAVLSSVDTKNPPVVQPDVTPLPSHIQNACSVWATTKAQLTQNLQVTRRLFRERGRDNLCGPILHILSQGPTTQCDTIPNCEQDPAVCQHLAAIGPYRLEVQTALSQAAVLCVMSYVHESRATIHDRFNTRELEERIDQLIVQADTISPQCH